MFPFSPLSPEQLRLLFPMSVTHRMIRWHTAMVQSAIYHATWMFR